MKKYAEVGVQIVEFLNSSIQKTARLITTDGSRFVVCGTSGSGKSRAISLANDLLPKEEQIAESQDLLREDCPNRAFSIINDSELEYAFSRHIGFNVFNASLARYLEKMEVKVFWLDAGSSSGAGGKSSSQY